VQECLPRAREAGLAWPLAPELNEEALHARLYQRQVPLSRTPQPDFAHIHAELKRRGVTRLLLWQEYKAQIFRPRVWRAGTRAYRGTPRRRSRSTSRAALCPGTPVTPPPGCAPEPQR